MKLVMVALVDNHWSIGNDEGLLVRIPQDMDQFRTITLASPIIYGRKTLATFPRKQPLSGRFNIIMSRNVSYTQDGATIAHSIQDLADILSGISDKYSTAYVIGGAEIYKQLLPYCNEAFITYVHQDLHGNQFIENLLDADNWEVDYLHPMRNYKGLRPELMIFGNRNVLPIPGLDK